jgi:hypothetical protein
MKNNIQHSFWFCCLCAVLYSSSVFAQKDSAARKFCATIQLNAGLSAPLTFDYATSGAAISLCANIPIKHKQYGFTGMLNYETNPFNIEIFGNIKQPKNYQLYSSFIGPYVEFPLRRISINCRFSCGVFNLKTPQVINSENGALSSPQHPTLAGTWLTFPGTVTSFAMDIGAGIKFESYSKVFFAFNIDVFHSGLNGGFDSNTQFKNRWTGQISYTDNWIDYSEILLFLPTISIGFKI